MSNDYLLNDYLSKLTGAGMFELFSPRRSDRSLLATHLNRWDWILLPLVLAVLAAVAFGAMQMTRPFTLGQPTPISLDPSYLPYYLLRTILRMFTALACALLFSFAFAAIAAKYKTAEKVMIPLLDILQSVPILGFQAIAIAPFIALFPGNLLGVECAAIFAIFTSQAWNMAFSLNQSMRTVLPGLLWNMMMSMSGGWFFLVAAEAVSVAGQDIKLPGIGAYIAVAIEAEDGRAIAWAIGAMLAGILLYDQLFFRPLLAWAGEFRFEESQGDTAQHSWLLDWGRRSRMIRALTDRFRAAMRGALGWFGGARVRSAAGRRSERHERA